MWTLYGMVSDEFVFGFPGPIFKVTEINSVYQLVNMETCKIIDQHDLIWSVGSSWEDLG